MSRSAYKGRCGHRLGWMSENEVLHPNKTTRIVFVDLITGTMTFRCPECGATMQFRNGRVDLNGEN